MTTCTSDTTTHATTPTSSPAASPIGGGRPIESVAAEVAGAALSGELADHAWTHWSFVLTTVHLVDLVGARAATVELRSITDRLGLPCLGGAPTRTHETLLVFFVWAVDRLRRAGLTTTQVLWHPLVAPTAPLAWYRRDELRSLDHAVRFVPSSIALPGEPAPQLPDA